MTSPSKERRADPADRRKNSRECVRRGGELLLLTPSGNCS